MKGNNSFIKIENCELSNAKVKPEVKGQGNRKAVGLAYLVEKPGRGVVSLEKIQEKR